MCSYRKRPVTSATEIELLALVEKLGPTDLLTAASILFTAWCEDSGVSHDKAHEFFVRIIELQTSEARDKLKVLADALQQTANSNADSPVAATVGAG